MLNLFVPIYPLVIEGIIIGDRGLTVSRLDLWFANQVLGGYNRDGYASFLLTSYAISAGIGIVIAYLSLGPIFKRLLTKNEVTFGDRELAGRLVDDWFLGILLIELIFDPILAWLVGYRGPAPMMGPFSLISLYVLVGFLTGGTIVKSILPLIVHLKIRRENLRIKSEFLDGATKSGKSRRLVRWVLQKKQPC